VKVHNVFPGEPAPDPFQKSHTLTQTLLGVKSIFGFVKTKD